jgi:hypothetical protein
METPNEGDTMNNAIELIQLQEKTAQEIRDGLHAIGPNHVLYQPLMTEMDALEAQIAKIRADAEQS